MNGDTVFVKEVLTDDWMNRNRMEYAVKSEQVEKIKFLFSFKEIKRKLLLSMK